MATVPEFALLVYESPEAFTTRNKDEADLYTDAGPLPRRRT